MNKATGLLILPTPEAGVTDPLGLLNEGPCDARPPTAYLLGTQRWAPCDGRRPPYGGLHDFALVLGWAEKPVPAGLFRLWYRAGNPKETELLEVLYTSPFGSTDFESLLNYLSGWEYREKPLGRFILVDSTGQEVIP